jgi:Zn-dependent protease
MNLHVVIVIFDIIVFLFAISVHESAHAWMANRLGDPTARMLGRVTLNPIKHIDIFGTILLPAISLITGAALLGWAKPTPVNTRNFKHLVRDDIITSLVGPISNFIVAIGCFVVLGLIAKISVPGHDAVQALASGGRLNPSATVATVTPIAVMFYEGLFINVLLGVFNLIPLPPLDGSHVLRHFLPDRVRRAFDMAGISILWILVLLRIPFLGPLFGPAMRLFDSNLLRF